MFDNNAPDHINLKFRDRKGARDAEGMLRVTLPVSSKQRGGRMADTRLVSGLAQSGKDAHRTGSFRRRRQHASAVRSACRHPPVGREGAPRRSQPHQGDRDVGRDHRVVRRVHRARAVDRPVVGLGRGVDRARHVHDANRRGASRSSAPQPLRPTLVERCHCRDRRCGRRSARTDVSLLPPHPSRPDPARQRAQRSRGVLRRGAHPSVHGSVRSVCGREPST